jgi:lysophospholipase L1-like esterase
VKSPRTSIQHPDARAWRRSDRRCGWLLRRSNHLGTRHLLVGLTLLLALALAATARPLAADAAGKAQHLWIVSLGDSYTAGNGAGNYYGRTGCYQSYDSYPWRFMDILRNEGYSADIYHAACSGAHVSDLSQQASNALAYVGRRSGSPDIVLLTIGGNDLGFVTALPCLFPSQDLVSYCGAIISNARKMLPGVMAKTESALLTLHQRMPQAQIFLIGYPRLTSPPCPTTWNNSIGDIQNRLDSGQQAVVDELNYGLGRKFFHFVGLGDLFWFHGPCNPAGAPSGRWINALAWPPFATAHPNKTGHQKIADWLYEIGVQNWVPGAGNPTPSPPPLGPTYAETTGGLTHTWTDYTSAGGNQGPSIPNYTTVQIACKVSGFRVADGNTWWYRIASSPWNSSYYASADAFYNNGQTSGSLQGTPFVDPNVPDC